MTMQYYAPRTRHNIRSVTLSNTVLLVSPSLHIDGSENQVVVQYSHNELFELMPAVPKPHRVIVFAERT
jgi:hypothetical protein